MAFVNATDNPDFITGPGFGSGIIFETTHVVAAGNTVSETPAYVGNAPGVVVAVAFQSSVKLQCRLLWLDGPSLASTPVRNCDYFSNVGGQFVDAVLSTGPFLTVQSINQDVVPGLILSRVFTVPGTQQGVGGTRDGALGSVANLVVPALSTSSQFPDFYVPGMAAVCFFASAPGITASISSLDLGGNTKISWIRDTVAGQSLCFNDIVSLPRNGWQFSFTNSTAGGIGVDFCCTTTR